jgi:hypothetical protein
MASFGREAQRVIMPLECLSKSIYTMDTSVFYPYYAPLTVERGGLLVLLVRTVDVFSNCAAGHRLTLSLSPETSVSLL